ncbi:MAG: fibronectin type III domain-containing protein, partial [Phycisphaerae bacterium]|nr:fibronectin type III domain-containing protein [Phycisphaerae bacterium]
MCTNRRFACLIFLVLLGIVGSAFAADIQWDNSGGDRLWRTATNWDLNQVPTTADKAAIRNAAVQGPIIDSSTTAQAAQVVVGDWSSSSDTLDITGGSLTATSWFVLGYSASNNGTLTMSGGTINAASTLDVGNSGTGTINMTGGTINVSSRFGIALLAGSNGDVFLDGGVISCGSLSISSAGAMDITGGTLIVNGDATSTINGYISGGLITAYGGSGTLNVDYNVSNPGQTTVTANTAEKAAYPSPTNGGTGISINADLSWVAGQYATTHDVYFGTDSTPDETEFQGNQAGTSFDPGTLTLGTTYYWRIDEVNPSNPSSPWIGDVWSFTTQTGTAVLRKGPYLIYPGVNTQMTVLWQLDASESCTLEWGLDTNYTAGSANVSEYGTDHQYKYTITGLTPGEKYYYKVTVGAGITTGNFLAAPDNSATNVKFLMYGDTRTNAVSQASVCAGMNNVISADPAYQTMLLLAGDWVETNAETNW